MATAIKSRSVFRLLIRAIRQRFSLIEDKADDAQIDSSIRSGVVLRGTNLWVLIFAIFVASIGLNVNSTAVIIGAMLISPLMGPIMGIGYGIGIYDAQLIQKSIRNLGIATLISLLVSTLYFFLTPLSDAHSELLARTSPTIWDVLIALFGGLAGIIGATRSEKTNVIPGVAIATALMPPLCTVGYGLANAKWDYFFGAFYLYTINCVFIAIAAVLIIWVLNPAHKKFVHTKTEVKVRRILASVVIVTMLPSIYLAIQLVKDEVFQSKAKQILAHELATMHTQIATQDINPRKRQIELTLIGDTVSNSDLRKLEAKLSDAGLPSVKLIAHQAASQHIDVSAIKSNIVSDLYKENLLSIEQKNQTISELQAKLAKTANQKKQWREMAAEINIQYPEITEIYFSEASYWKKGEGTITENLLVMHVKVNKKPQKDMQYKLTEWLKLRSKSDNVKVVIE